jgi:hypothetical protein
MYDPIKEKGSWRIRTNYETGDMLQGAEIVKLTELLRLRWYGHNKRINNKRMPKQILITRMEEMRKNGRSQ